MNNPCINLLKQYSNKVYIKTGNVMDDYILLLQAQILILSWSSFSDTTVYLSPNLKTVFYLNYEHCFGDKSQLPKDISFKSLTLNKPYIKRGEWDYKNKKQVNLMIQYPITDIEFEN